jgi:hypothetical protein
VFRIRFCLAPTSSSLSRRSTARSPLFTTRSVGTEPPSLTSVTVRVFPDTASSRVSQSGSAAARFRSGTTASLPKVAGEPTASFSKNSWTTGLSASVFMGFGLLCSHPLRHL